MTSVGGGGQTEKDPSGWTVDTLREFMIQQIEDMRRILDERYQTQTRAVDAAFLAQRTAMETALTAAEKAVGTALASAEKAVGKAEIAAEKRFDAVNEFRAQLSDQAATFMPRSESEARTGALAEKVDGLATRIDKTEGRSGGRSDSWGYLVGAMGLLIALASLILANLP
jgi:hypothetical protein